MSVAVQAWREYSVSFDTWLPIRYNAFSGTWRLIPPRREGAVGWLRENCRSIPGNQRR